MKLFRRTIPWCFVALFLPAGMQAGTNTNVRTTWLGHLHQPVYARPLQMQLNYTDAPSITATHRFYRLQLLP